MTVNFKRTATDLTEDLLIADGWDFSGFGLYRRKDRQREASCDKATALRETLSRHLHSMGGDSLYEQFGDNPTDDQLLEALRVVRLILDPIDKVNMLEVAIVKINDVVNSSDGRITNDFKTINTIASDVLTQIQDDRNRRVMRSDFKIS